MFLKSAYNVFKFVRSLNTKVKENFLNNIILKVNAYGRKSQSDIHLR